MLRIQIKQNFNILLRSIKTVVLNDWLIQIIYRMCIKTLKSETQKENVKCS